MDNQLKFYLLAEESGWNCSIYAFQYSNKIKDSEAYKILSGSVSEIRKVISSRAYEVVKGYDSLNFDLKTVKDCFILETKVNYLSLHSFPEYYLNPFTIDPNYEGEVKSIGDLMFSYHRQEVPLNEIIMSNLDTPEEKKKLVNNQLEYHLSDTNELVYQAIDAVKSRAFSSQRDTKAIGKFLEALLFIILNVLLLVMATYPTSVFRYYLVHPDPSRVMTYIWYLYPVLLLLYDITFIAFHTYRARISEPYNYAKRFLRKNSDKVFDDLRNGKEKLYDYIAGAINNRLTLKNDIKEFSKLSSSYIDFKAVMNVASLKNKRLYKVLYAMTISFSTLAGFLGLISFVVFILGIIFNAGT